MRDDRSSSDGFGSILFGATFTPDESGRVTLPKSRRAEQMRILIDSQTELHLRRYLCVISMGHDLLCPRLDCCVAAWGDKPWPLPEFMGGCFCLQTAKQLLLSCATLYGGSSTWTLLLHSAWLSGRSTKAAGSVRPSATTGHLCGLCLCIFSLVVFCSHVSVSV